MTRRKVSIPDTDSVLGELYAAPAPAPAPPAEQPAENTASRARVRTRARTTAREPGRTNAQTDERKPGRASDRSRARTSEPEQAPAWDRQHRRAIEVQALAYAASLRRARQRGADLARLVSEVPEHGGGPAELAGVLALAGLGPDDLPPDVARAAGL